MHTWKVCFTLCQCYSFCHNNIWINKGALDIFVLVINFLTLDWEPKHVTIGLFKTKGIVEINLVNNYKFYLRNISWLTKIFVMWNIKAQIYLQWKMFLNKSLVIKNWGYWHHLKAFFFAMPFFKLANMPLLLKS